MYIKNIEQVSVVCRIFLFLIYSLCLTNDCEHFVCNERESKMCSDVVVFVVHRFSSSYLLVGLNNTKHRAGETFRYVKQKTRFVFLKQVWAHETASQMLAMGGVRLSWWEPFRPSSCLFQWSRWHLFFLLVMEAFITDSTFRDLRNNCRMLGGKFRGILFSVSSLKVYSDPAPSRCQTVNNWHVDNTRPETRIDVIKPQKRSRLWWDWKP